jgi:hypothetical protein
MRWQISMNRVWPFTSPIRSVSFCCMLLCMVVCVVLMAGQATGGETKCYHYTAVLDGSCTFTLPYPKTTVTCNQHFEMHKVELKEGYDGQWQVDKVNQTMAWSPLSVDLPPTSEESGTEGMTCTTEAKGNTIYEECTGGNFILDVANNKVGVRAANLWFGEIKGNGIILQCPTIPCYCQPLSVGVITEAKEKISLTVTSPKTDSRHVYSNDSPGELKLELAAKANPEKYNDKIKWTIPEIKGNKTKRTTIPDPPVGPKVKVTYSGLPEENSEFGKKTIVATLDVQGCEVEDEVEIKVFFPRDKTNNPGPGDVETGDPLPNWFYYWKQTSAATLRDKARYEGSACRTFQSMSDGIGYYERPTRTLADHYYICDLVRILGTEMWYKTDVPELTPDASDFQGKTITTTGIDTFAAASLHEAEHLKHLTQWWGAIRSEDREKFDTDDDLIPDSVELNYTWAGIKPFKPDTKRTYPGLCIDDEELYTRLEADAMFTVDDPKRRAEDWACPGKQWQ